MAWHRADLALGAVVSAFGAAPIATTLPHCGRVAAQV
jgi:hypothetical protein